MQFSSVIETKTGLLIILCSYFLWRLRLVHLRLSNRALSPTLITVLLGFGVIVAHLLIAKWLWGFPWADVEMGSPVVAVVALDIGYFYIRCKKLSAPRRDSGIIETFHEPAVGRTHANLSARSTGGNGGDSATCEERRPCHLRFTTEMRGLGILETSREIFQCTAHVPRWPRCKPLGIPVPPRMAQNRCNRTQKKHPAQLPNVRF